MRLCRHFLLVAAFLWVSTAAAATDRPFAWGICLTKPTIELGTYAAVQVWAKNTSSEPIWVSLPGLDIPVRYTSCRPVVTSDLPAEMRKLESGEIRFWSAPVPKDTGFTPLLLGRYEANVVLEVRWGVGVETFKKFVPNREDVALDALPQDGREVLHATLAYNVVEPGQEMGLMRQLYTRSVEACDQVDGKQVMVSRLDTIGAAKDARTEFEQSFGARSQAASPDGIDAERLAARFAHPAHRAATAFRHYVGSAPGDTFNYDGALRTLDWHLRQTVWHQTGPLTEGELSAKERSVLDGGDAFAILRAVYIYSRDGADKSLAYLKTLDAQRFNCADRAFFDEFVERISRKKDTATRGGGQDPASGARP